MITTANFEEKVCPVMTKAVVLPDLTISHFEIFCKGWDCAFWTCVYTTELNTFDTCSAAIGPLLNSDGKLPV